MKILAIETSCDDTAAALIEGSGTGKNARVKIISQVAASQIPLHRRYGGVVPEVAARAHAETIMPLVAEVFDQAGYKKNILAAPPIDAIAVTCGPGLVTSLWVGVSAAKTFAWLWNKPVFGVNHIVGHIFSACLERALPEFPALAVIVSGGHTELIWLPRVNAWKKIGATRDDAAGEAFDKFGKLLGFPYPGGPQISALAEHGNPAAINFPRPMLTDANLDFSFAGLKTSGRTWLEKQKKLPPKLKADACASYQQAIVDVIVKKTERAILARAPRTVLLGGGVAANDALRSALAEMCQKNKTKILLPEKKFTGDNAAMIGAAAYFAPRAFKTTWPKLAARPNFELQ